MARPLRDVIDNPRQPDRYHWTDVSIDTGALIHDYAAVTNFLNMLWQTPVGSAWGQPTYGWDGYGLLFSAVSQRTANDLLAKTAEAVRLWIPAVTLFLSQSYIRAEPNYQRYTIRLAMQLAGLSPYTHTQFLKPSNLGV